MAEREELKQTMRLMTYSSRWWLRPLRQGTETMAVGLEGVELKVLGLARQDGWGPTKPNHET